MNHKLAIVLLILAGCSTSQPSPTAWQQALRISGETIVAKQDESLTILRENTTALAAIKSQIDTLKASQSQSEPGNGKECDLESDPPQNTDTVVNDSHAASPGTQPVAVSAVELFVCSTASCAPCKRMWRDVDDGKLEGFLVTKVPAFDGLKSYPAIRFANPDSDTGWSVIYGYDEDTRLWLRARLLGEQPVASSRIECYPVAMSHSEMKALHDQLHGGGSWTWPGNLATHLATTHGVSTGGAPLTGAIFQVHGQSGIQSSRSFVRSNSWGSRFVGRASYTARQSCPSCPR